MDPSRTRDTLRARMAELDARPPLEKVRDLLNGHVVDTDGWGEIRDELRMTVRHSARPLRQGLDAIDAVLAAELPPGTLLRMVAGEAGKSLDHDPTDAGAAAFLRELAALIRSVLDEAA
ncbi:hypothetical protein ODJ79_21455 [Actinoplanes sp. KI2]|uniref:hypothetical protein n=1 Tax=Actinoplanes sp. KI2 TaxID=2983315 RepID=UPI0021D58C0F|nr:hypothetical protein [Actinoplanes sp. KI2]MCU7726304.1 hypothetical protein [Actinoplanes sp. KI2]